MSEKSVVEDDLPEKPAVVGRRPVGRTAISQETVRLVSMELRLENSARWGGVFFHGKTMLPFLQDGDELTIEPTSWRDVRPGEIVTYRNADLFPTRRIIDYLPKREEFIFQGDGLPQRRIFRVPREDVLGRVVARRRKGTVITHRDFSWKRAASKALWRARLYRRMTRALQWMRAVARGQS